jgi:hypothetical protein
MIKPIEKVICKEIHKFVEEHIEEVENKIDWWGEKQTYQELGFKNKTDMLKQIKNDVEIAVWALQELMVWGMSPSHDKQSYDYSWLLFTEGVNGEDDATVYKIGCPQRYFTTNSDWETRETTVTEVKKVTKLVEVTTWENVN